MNYKNIVFDFGNVLARFDEERVLSKYCPSPEDFPMMKDAVFYDWDAMDTGTIEYEAYMFQVVQSVFDCCSWLNPS